MLAVLTAGSWRTPCSRSATPRKPQVRAEAAAARAAGGRQAGQPRHLLHPVRRHPGLPGRPDRGPAGAGRRRTTPGASWPGTTGCTGSPSASARASGWTRPPPTAGRATCWASSRPAAPSGSARPRALDVEEITADPAGVERRRRPAGRRFRCVAQVRAHGGLAPAAGRAGGGPAAAVRLDEPLRGVAPGQTVALYRPDAAGDVVLGSATIAATGVTADRTSVSDAAEDAVRHPVVRALGRVGLVAYGVVHLLLAGLLVQVAFGDQERVDKKGALQDDRRDRPGRRAAVGHRARPGRAWSSGSSARRSGATTGCRTGAACCAPRSTWPRPRCSGCWPARPWSIAAPAAPSAQKSFAAVVFELPGGRWLVALGGLVRHRRLALRGAPRADPRLPARARPARRRARTAPSWSPGSASSAGRRSASPTAFPGCCWWSAAATYDPAAPTGLDAGLQRHRRRALRPAAAGRCSRSGWSRSGCTACSTPGTARPDRRGGPGRQRG